MINDAYLGNPNLKKINTPVEFTKEQIVEYQKCAGDPLYFMEEYVKIVSLDEGLIPFKTLNFGSGVNFTSGLPIVRTSPDHGTAYNLIGKKNVNNKSFLNCYKLIQKIHRNRMNNVKSKKIS